MNNKESTHSSGSTSSSSPKKYSALCLGVGGLKGLLMLGALHTFWIRGQMENLAYYSGSSVGALIVSLLAVGYEPIDLLVSLCDPVMTGQFASINLANIGSIMGLYPHSIIRNKLEKLVLAKLGYLPTFGDLKTRLGKHVIITSYCLSEQDPAKCKVYFDPDNYPDMPIVEAIILSCNIPGIFARAKYADKIWMDGAYVSLFPIKALQDVVPAHLPILGIAIKTEPINLETITGYFYAIFGVLFRDQNNLGDIRSNTDVVEVHSEPSSKSFVESINFAASASQKVQMFAYGVKQVQ